jgi:preprotein translocase subunit SecA
MLWVEHLESMEYLRGSVNLRAYGQRDPLVEYRKEGTRIYKEMESETRRERERQKNGRNFVDKVASNRIVAVIRCITRRR